MLTGDSQTCGLRIRPCGLAAVTSQRCGDGVVLSHRSAAAVHDIALLKADTTVVHVTRDARSGGGRRAQRQVHAVALPDDAVVDLGRFRVTSMERTAVDVATDGASSAHALTVFDMALARGASRELMTELLAAAAIAESGPPVGRCAVRPGSPSRSGSRGAGPR